MSEMKRHGMIKVLLEKKRTIAEAALALDLPTREIIRIKNEVTWCGRQAVHQKNRGLPPKRYFDFNFSLISQRLADQEGVHINSETFRRSLCPLAFSREMCRLCPPPKEKTLCQGKADVISGCLSLPLVRQ